MGIVCTNTWPGTGALWTAAGNNSSDGSAWTQTTSLLSAWTTLTTSASANVGTFTAQPNAAGSAAVWRTGGSSPNDAHVHAVFSMSSGQTTSSRVQGVILNKTATTANTYYAAIFNVTASKGSNVYGIELRRYNAGGLTTLFAPYSTITGLNGSTAKWIIQFRATRIDGGASVLLQARAWQGTNPASPPAGCDWVMSGGITGSGYQSVAVTDTSPLAAGRGGLFLQGVAGTSFTGTFEQFEFRQLSAQTVTATNAQTVTTIKNVGKPLTATALGNALSTIRNVGKSVTATVASTVVATRAIAIVRAVTTSSAVTIVNGIGKQVTGSTSTTIAMIRDRALTVATTLVAGVTIARAITKTMSVTLGTVAAASRTNLQAVLATLGSAVTTIVRKLVPEPPRYVQLSQTSTAQLGQTTASTLTQPSTSQLGQTTNATLPQPTIVRLPKE